MTKSDLIEKVWETNKLLTKKAVSEIIDQTFKNLSKSIKKDGRFTYPAFGTFTLRKRKARMGRNPQTGEELKIAASRTVTFKPAPVFKGKL
jgi:nucleoid DNA-binding protein